MSVGRRAAVAAAIVLGGCDRGAAVPPVTAPAATPNPPAAVAPPLASPEDTIAALERRLLDASRVHIVFEVESHGEVETDLRGVLVVDGDGRALLEAQGTFAGQAGTAKLECDGTTLRGRSGTARLEMPCPAAMGPALVLGLTRMGVLHNLARAWSARPPDRSEATTDTAHAPRSVSAAMDAWVRTTTHRRVRDRATTDTGDAVAFDIVVDAQPVGDATLHLDAVGAPTRREQTVRFPGGEMRVVERYESVEIVPPAAGE